MNNEDYRKLEEINKRYLDSLDLSDIVIPNRLLSDITYDVERRYNDDPNMPEELKGFALNCFDDYDFGIYLAARYNMKLREEVIYNYYLN